MNVKKFTKRSVSIALAVILVGLLAHLAACGPAPTAETAQAAPTQLPVGSETPILPDPSQMPPSGAAVGPTSIPTAFPIDPKGYQGWWAYNHPAYGFSIMLPPDWVVEEVTSGDALMNGHQLNLLAKDSPGGEKIRMAFRLAGEEVPLWPTGVGAGEFVTQGTLDIAGQAAVRRLFICPGGQVQSIWYFESEDHADIQRGGLEFGFIFSFTKAYCQEGYSLGGKDQHFGEMIIASLALPSGK
jgi:hypothetical protein